MKEIEIGGKKYRGVSTTEVFETTRLSRAHPPAFVFPGPSDDEWLLYWHCGARYIVDVARVEPHSRLDRIRFRLQLLQARLLGRRLQSEGRYTTCRQCWYWSHPELQNLTLLLIGRSEDQVAEFLFEWMKVRHQWDIYRGDTDFVVPIPDWPFGPVKALKGYRYFCRRGGHLYLTPTHPDLVDPAAEFE